MFIVMFALYFILNLYIFFHIRNFVKALTNKKYINYILLIVIVLLSILGIASFVISNSILKMIGFTYLGFFVYFLIVFLISDLIYIVMRLFKRNVSKKVKVITFVAEIVISIIIVVYGSINASGFKIVNYDIDVNKSNDYNESLSIALLSDLHLGHNIGPDYVQRIVDEINSRDVDLVLIAGDILDNSLYELEDEDEYIKVLSKLKSGFGVYGVTGNHDTFNENSDGTLFSKLGIEMLNDESVIINDKVNLIGKNSDRVSSSEDIIKVLDDIDTSLPTILMIHEPTNIEDYFDKDIDLIVAGHTHNGQIFPGNIICDLIYYNAYGLKKDKDTNTIVSSGAGLWGPKLRIGTNNEIVYINFSY